MFSSDTPLFEATGLVAGQDRSHASVTSYLSVHDELSAKTKSFIEKYKQHVIAYVFEWEKTVTTRVNNGIKKVEDARRELNHYQKKVEALRLSNNKALAKGKNVKNEDAEKLERNEEKYLQAKQSYDRMSTALCILMDEIAERNWRDLHPVLVKLLQFDMTMSSDEAKLIATLSSSVSQLKAIGTQHGIPQQSRLGDLGTLSPDLLSTRPGGVASLKIEASPSVPTPSYNPSPTNSAGGDIFGTGGQVGGFPVRTQSSGSGVGGDPYDPNSSSNPLGALDNSFSQMNFGQPAPPPQMNDIFNAGAYGAPPPVPQQQPGYHHSSSMGDLSAFSSGGNSYGGAAPPPAAPPPPPPAGAPPMPPSGALVPSATPSNPYSMPPSPYGQQPPPNAWGQPASPSTQSSYSASPYGTAAPPPPAMGAPPMGAPPPPMGAPPNLYGAAYGQAPGTNPSNPFG